MKKTAKRPLPSRDDQIKSLQSESFDVLIVGGGATGAGCALDAVTRGKCKLQMRTTSKSHAHIYFEHKKVKKNMTFIKNFR